MLKLVTASQVINYDSQILSPQMRKNFVQFYIKVPKQTLSIQSTHT